MESMKMLNVLKMLEFVKHWTAIHQLLFERIKTINPKISINTLIVISFNLALKNLINLNGTQPLIKVMHKLNVVISVYKRMLKSPGHAKRLKVKTGHARSQKLTFQLDYTGGLHATTDGRLRKESIQVMWDNTPRRLSSLLCFYLLP